MVPRYVHVKGDLSRDGVLDVENFWLASTYLVTSSYSDCITSSISIFINDWPCQRLMHCCCADVE